MLTRLGALIIFKLCFAEFFCVRSAIPIGAGCIGAPLVLAAHKQDDRVQGVSLSPIFMLITYYLGFTKQEKEIH
jgi:hypothetical protein